jgi:putative transposase
MPQGNILLPLRNRERRALAMSAIGRNIRRQNAPALSPHCHKRKCKAHRLFGGRQPTLFQWNRARSGGDSAWARKRCTAIQRLERDAATLGDVPNVASVSLVPDVDEGALWRDRTLAPDLAIAAFDRLPIRIREGNGARDASLLFCLAVRGDGSKDVLGVWPGAQREAWRDALADLRRRGLRRARMVLGDFDESLDDAIGRSFPGVTRMQYLPHLMHRSLLLAPPKRRRALCTSLTEIVRAGSAQEGRMRLDRFAASRDGLNYPSIAIRWIDAWPWLASHFDMPAGVRRFLETLDASESLREKLARRAARLQVCHRSEDAALHATTSALLRVATTWRVAPKLWSPAARYFNESAIARPRPIVNRPADARV